MCNLFVKQKIKKINANDLQINIMVWKIVNHLRDENCFGDLRFCAGVAEYSVLGYDAASLGKGLPKDKASYGGIRET